MNIREELNAFRVSAVDAHKKSYRTFSVHRWIPIRNRTELYNLTTLTGTLEGPLNNNLKKFRVFLIKKLSPILMQCIHCTVVDKVRAP
jgi:hypothetical protein